MPFLQGGSDETGKKSGANRVVFNLYQGRLDGRFFDMIVAYII